MFLVVEYFVKFLLFLSLMNWKSNLQRLALALLTSPASLNSEPGVAHRPSPYPVLDTPEAEGRQSLDIPSSDLRNPTYAKGEVWNKDLKAAASIDAITTEVTDEPRCIRQTVS